MDLEGLSAVCSGFGFPEEDEHGVITGYTKGEFCLDNLKDLQRFLRRDDPQTRDVFKQICKWDTVSNDLVPILEHYQTDHKLVINAVKILVFLTMPIDPGSEDIPRQIDYLWRLKAAIARNDTIAAIVSFLEDPLERLECEAFTEDDWKLVQLVLTLFRNTLAIQEITSEQKASGSASQYLSLRDRFLELLFQENVMDLILVLTQHAANSRGYIRQDNLLLLEVFYYIFFGQKPEFIAEASCKESKVDGGIKTSLNSLKALMEEEEERRRLNRLRNVDRHSQFTGTFTRLGMDGSKTVLKGNPGSNSGGNLLKAHKVQRGPLKRIAWNHESQYLPKESVLCLLHDFVNQFLSGAYNVLMQSIREDIEKEYAIQNSDVIVFLRVAHFATAFQHHKFSMSESKLEASASEASSPDKSADSTLFYGDICGPIAATMNEAMFLLVISKWRDAFDSLKQTHEYKFLSAAGSIMKDMIRLLALVLKLLPEDSTEPQTARILLYKLFYDQTDQGLTHFLVNLIRSFDTHKQSRSDLADLVEMAHTILKLMETLQSRGILRVAKKSRKSKKKKLACDGPATESERINEAHASDISDNQNIVNDLNTGKQVKDMNQPMDDSIRNLSPDKQEENPKQIREAEMNQLEAGNIENDDSAHMDKYKSTDGVDALAYENGDFSDDEQPAERSEVDFNVSKLVATFANNSCIHNLCWLLKFYKSNSARTNYYIISIFQRISDDLELSPMFYQLSLLTTFYDILNDQKSSGCKEFATVVAFLTTLVRKMLKKMKSQPLLFVEILFLKTYKECQHISADSLLNVVHNLKKRTGEWGSISDDDRESGPMKHKEGPAERNIADALGDDEADFPFSHGLDYHMEEDSFNGNIEKALQKDTNYVRETNSDLVNHHKKGRSLKNKSQRVLKHVFDIEQEAAIKDLYDKFKDSQDCSRLIAEALDPERKISPVQVSAKLKQLGLKVVSKKKVRQVDRQTGVEVVTPKDLADGSLQTSSSHTRKRVHAFSEEQEIMVKELFELYKNEKRCSHMIASALGADNTYTAAQVSRKLRQLGLHVSRQKRLPDGTKNSGQNDGKDMSAVEREEGSDEETLLELKKRRKSKGNNNFSSKEDTIAGMPKKNGEASLPQEDSIDDFLSTILQRKGKRKSNLISKESTTSDTSKWASMSTISQVISADDEMLSSILARKSKKSKLISKESPGTDTSKWESRISLSQVTSSDDEKLSSILEKTGGRVYSKSKDNNISAGSVQEEEAPQDMTESDVQGQFKEELLQTGDKRADEIAEMDDNVEAVLADKDGNKEGTFAAMPPQLSGKVETLLHQQNMDDMADMLADSDDEEGPVLVKSVGLRRKMKMIIDAEDDV